MGLSLISPTQPQRVEGEVLASDTLPPQHTRQARSAPAPPSGQQANYNQALDEADLRSSLSQLLGRLLSGKGENAESGDKVNRRLLFLSLPPRHDLQPPPFRSPPCFYSAPPLPWPVTPAVPQSHHLPLPSLLPSFFHTPPPPLADPTLPETKENCDKR